MGAKKPTPRNPKALAGKRLRGAPNTHSTWDIGTLKGSPSLRQIQARETGYGCGA